LDGFRAAANGTPFGANSTSKNQIRGETQLIRRPNLAADKSEPIETESTPENKLKHVCLRRLCFPRPKTSPNAGSE